MTILLLNKNLLWTVRLRKALTAEGHTVLSPSSLDALPNADVAIINLYDYHQELKPLVAKLKTQNTFVLAHAGHKDKDLWEQATRAGCHRVISNGEIAARLPVILKELERYDKEKVPNPTAEGASHERE
ncbi:MAG: hypothetical protein K6T17_06285 [Fimbriimonadales bacterium]|nr:hypothetical protein [Fimbriimonadales bacterium]